MEILIAFFEVQWYIIWIFVGSDGLILRCQCVDANCSTVTWMAVDGPKKNIIDISKIICI